MTKITTEEAERRRQQWGEFLTGPIFWMSVGPIVIIVLLRLCGCDLGGGYD